MAARTARRGVLVTASSKRPRPLWDEDLEASGDEGSDEEQRRLASQREWQELERSVREETRLRRASDQLASGLREGVAEYDDVAGEPVEQEPLRPSPSSGGEEEEAADGADEAGEGSVAGSAAAEDQRPDGVVTAGQAQRAKRRGGQKKTGGQRRKKAREEEDRRRDDEDEDRWLRLRIAGEQKPKRIDATRIVSYFDFDAQARRDLQAAEAPSAPPGNLRASLRLDLFADGDDDDEE